MQQDIIILDRESRKKCTIYPLSYRPDLLFMRSSNIDNKDFTGYLLLHVDGPPLSSEDQDFPLLLVDASWRWAHRICTHPNICNLSKRSLAGFTTAYPRISQFYKMPDQGLASVEALYLARLIQQREDLSLLDHYYWKEKFLQLNQQQIAQLRINCATP